ncbi:MAG TPA: response regulator, partial [Planctomycetota bacterium]|nr:response regulator [Planctomycetota bacterium]
MGRERRPALILLADDDDDDVLLTRRAFESARLANPLVRVRDGEELLAYLRGEPPFDDRAAHPSPSLVLLDLNMPRKDGREALHEIKADPSLRAIPVVVLTTS